jgi:chromosome partitioning protein
VYVVFNGNAPQATAILAQATEVVRSMGLQTAPFELSERAIYRHATGAGKAVTELEPIGKAAREVEALWEWLCEQIGIVPNNQIKAA